MTLLLIDDNEDITTGLARYLTLSGHYCATSNDGRNGLNMIETGSYDIVLLDLSMPDFSGIDIINALAEKNKLSEQKIIVFTASSVSKSEVDELIKKGVHSCLKKPIDPDELVKYLENIQGKNIQTQS